MENNSVRESNEQILRDYPIQDETWPSRRWNEEMTDFADLSGEGTNTEDLKDLFDELEIPDTEVTPAEWIYSGYTPYDFGIYTAEGNGRDIALVREYNSREDAEATAAKICKAVNSHDELVNALKKAMEIIERINDEFSSVAGKHGSYTNGEYKTLKEALTKANQ